ncbi:DNA-binding transcriptional LysR family regulator [Variovorax paradoxus]|nr:DNA-binding transcriptional LysR family regulator [Variovorax paradoxus]
MSTVSTHCPNLKPTLRSTPTVSKPRLSCRRCDPALALLPTTATIDLALVTLPAAGRSLNVLPVLDDEFVAIGRGDLAPPKARVGPADLAALPLVLLGYGIVPRMSMAGRGAHPDLKTSRLNPGMHRTLAIVIRRDKPVSKALRVVLDAILAAGKKGSPVTPAKSSKTAKR